MTAHDTIAALATPAGVSALALVRVSGPLARPLAEAVLSSSGLALPERRPIHASYRALDGRVLDELVGTFFAGPRTATGEDVLELTPHGNPLVIQLVLADLFARGCRPAEAGEFTRRAFLNGRMDLTQAEAVMDLIHARSERALVAAQRQLKGELGRHLDGLTQILLGLVARVEAYIDFPDEDLPPEDRNFVIAGLGDVLRGTNRLLATRRYGDLLREGLKTVLLGAPNAGKSSLLNALLGRDRALVSPEPGTTRDFLEESLQVGPHLLRLVDTAGLNPAPGELEQLGMNKTLERLAEADLVLWVVDGTGAIPVLPASQMEELTSAKTVLVVNKADLPPYSSAPVWPAGLRRVGLSALTGYGLEALRSAIIDQADALAPQLAAEEQITVNARHADALRRTEMSLHQAATGLLAVPPQPIELVAADLRGALDALGEIAGRIDNERVLDALFATFCIGK